MSGFPIVDKTKDLLGLACQKRLYFEPARGEPGRSGWNGWNGIINGWMGMDEAWMIMDEWMEGWPGGMGCSPRSLNWLFVGLDWRGEEEFKRRRWKVIEEGGYTISTWIDCMISSRYWSSQVNKSWHKTERRESCQCKRQQCPRETWNITVCKGAPSSRL